LVVSAGLVHSGDRADLSETVANPYATVLGPPETGTVRINFAQSGNGVAG